ncbi:nck-associated protein 5 isoform X2 [Myotis daubentonii]|uniref:nck-associated protein 5 isoform X2 n=1 Tax=Myotis daubentonii TaxID=98922 RepID=UPI0028737865|nr:nck-associated protein 5 isoform X2 [Myotis daubentonii]
MTLQGHSLVHLPSASVEEYMDSNKYIEHLLTQLEEKHRSLWREKLAVARLQREVAERRSEGAMHEKLIHELEEERHLRLQSEKRLQEVTLESERSRIQMRGLQQQFSRMEETVRNLLQSQGPPEQKKEDTVNIMVYQEMLSEDERKHKEALEDLHMAVDEDSRSESSSADEGKEKTKLLLERLKALEAENSALALENENQREQYERCLDEVANQVVQALLTQKDLREECVKLKTRVFDLEQQNRTLSILFQQRLRPASDLLLQKLHSRILDLSSGDLLAEVEQSRSLTQTRSDVETHECQLSAKSGAPALKGPGVGVVLPGHLCPRSRCSSSELSLSSTCSEYSSGSSCTWHDGKNLRRRPSSQNWDKRLSIDSSLPSGFASPTDELPLTRIKESHILEGLRKLQKRTVLLEPPSVITKWGYKDCMNSNEGIYSPGIKSSPKEHPPCNTADMGGVCKEPHQAFVYDTDSHEDADEDSTSLAWAQAFPSQVCRLHGCQLTHSVSDSLFSWELNGRHFSEGVYPRERPGKRGSGTSSCPSERQLCPRLQVPQGQSEGGPRSRGRVAVSLQLSDTDDNDTLDELHIGSSDEKSPSDLSLATDTDKSTENLDTLVGLGRPPLGPPGEEERAPSHVERPRTLGLLRRQRVVRRTSSEECVTVVFDAEDGEPIEFSSQQTGVVTVTRNEIAIAQAPLPTAGHTDRTAQGTAGLQPGAAARGRAFAFAGRPAGEAAGCTPGGGVGTVPVPVPEAAAAEPLGPGMAPPNPPRQKPARPTRNCASPVAMAICQKPSQTKIPARGKPPPQKPKLMAPEAGRRGPSSGPVTPERPPGPAPGKLPRGRRPEGPAPRCDLQPDPHFAKHGPQTSRRREGAQGPTGQLSAPLGAPRDHGEPLPRDRRRGPGPEAGPTSPPPPPPPGRSVSLLIRPRYDHVPPAPPARPEARVPLEAARAALRPPLLKGSSAPVLSSSQAEVPGRKPSVAFQKPLLAHPLNPPETGMQTRCPAYTPSGSLVMMAPGLPKDSPKRGVPQTPSHQTLGATHTDAGLRVPKNCPAAHEPLETAASESLSPGRQGPADDSGSASPKPAFLGVNESPPSQGNGPSASSRSHSAPHGGANPPEKGVRPRLPAGLQVLLKSPQPLRRSCTVPGKQEKDSLNEASRSSVAASKARPAPSGSPTGPEAAVGAGHGPPLGVQAADRLASALPPEAGTSETLEHRAPGAAGNEGAESRSVKRSLSSNKPHLKPALGMNGAKARSQSFSAHAGDKPPTPPMEGQGRVRTQIITNTAERGSSLTRQGSSEGSPSKAPAAPTPEGLPGGAGRLPQAPSGQGSLGSTGSACSPQGSPSKLPVRIPPPSEGLPAPPGPEDPRACTQGGCPGAAAPEGAGRDPCGGPPATAGCPRAPQSPGSTQCPSGFATGRTAKLEASGRHPDPSITRTAAASPEAPLSPSIEEKVMLCIQENVEKGQVQTKATSVEAKPRPGPSFASWFGFRRSRLPALSSRKMEASKPKVEKKDAKGLGFGHRQLKAERKKEKKKPEVESELRRDAELAVPPDAGFHSKSSRKAAQDIYEQVKFEELRNRPSPVACPTKDTFMTELLSRVDKRAAQQTESGSSNVSCRSVSKGSSQGSCRTSGSSSAQGNHKKTLKTKAEAEMPKGSLVKETTENLQEDEEDTVVDSAFQSHIIESNCQMRTLDSGIGTFPLPDSGTRSAGRYICQADPSGDTEPDLCLQPVLCAAPSIRAQTLEREVPSSADSQDFADNAIAHSTSDPTMTARGTRPLQSRLPKPAASGKIHSQKQNDAEPRPQTCSSVCAENTLARELLPDWRGEDPPADTQKLKQVEETKEDPENRLSKISLESFNKYNSNTVILLEKDKNSPNKVEGRKEEKEKNEEASLSSSDRPGVDNLESLSDSLYDSFSSCASQGSNDA